MFVMKHKNVRIRLMKKILLISFLFLLIFSPALTQAGIVPCGLTEDDPKQEGDQTIPCSFCHFFVLINNIIKFVMFTLVPSIAVLMLIVGGVMFFFAGAKPDMLIRAKGVITSVLIGLVIIFCAWVAVNTIITKIGIVESPALLQWHNIDCPI